MSIHDRSWADRPFDVANLLNPAFLGVIIRKAADSHVKEHGDGIPYETVFLIFPFILHTDTRQLLPKSIATRLQPWLYDHRHVLLGFGARTRELVPFVKEAMMFTTSRGVLCLCNSGKFWPGTVKLRGITAYQSKSAEIHDVLRKAEFVGRWLGGINTTSLYASLGIKP